MFYLVVYYSGVELRTALRVQANFTKFVDVVMTFWELLMSFVIMSLLM